MFKTESRIVKADGYNEIFKGENCKSRVEQPFYMQSMPYKTLADFYEKDGTAKGLLTADEAAFRSLWDEKRLNAKIIDALCWSRLFGGSAIIALVQDGRALKSPVKPGAMLEDVRVYDRYQIRVEARETNPRKVRYGEPVLYTVTPVETCRNTGTLHASLHYRWATQLLRRKQQAVWKAKGLADLCDDEEGVSAARLRLAQVDDEGGVGKAIGIDAEDEEYDVLNSDISGVDSFLKRKWIALFPFQVFMKSSSKSRIVKADGYNEIFKGENCKSRVEQPFYMQSMPYKTLADFYEKDGTAKGLLTDRIVSLSGIHEIILKNKNVGGVSASQNTALETFYKLIERKRVEDYKPILEFLLPFIISEQEWSIEFSPLSVPSDKDQAEILNKNIDSISKAIDGQFLDVEEARDTLRAIAPSVKLKDTNKIKLPEPAEPEPSTQGMSRRFTVNGTALQSHR
ncbi:UNVERIFIED_ASMBLY: putative portal protein [Shigella phage 2019SD1]|uniref:Portal protein n=1 Tax=Shigella phage 2019SD1 TaxID=2848074 RepID=A0A6M5CEG1_9CAUD|nr:putative portal protein [Shigella phage 2019SD1]